MCVFDSWWVMRRTLIAGFPMPSGCQWWAFLHLGCTQVCLTASAWSEGCCSWSPTWPFVRRGEVCACDGTPGIPANVTILGNNDSDGFVFYRRFFKMFYFQYLQLLLDCDEGVSGLSWLQPGQRPPDPFQQLKKITSGKNSWKHSICGVINWSIELSLSRFTNNLKIQLLMHWRCRKALGKLSSYPSILYITYLRLKLGGQRPWSWHLRKTVENSQLILLLTKWEYMQYAQNFAVAKKIFQ